MIHTYKDNYLLTKWTQKRFENNAPVKSDVLAYCIMGLVIAVGITTFFIKGIVSDYIQIGIFSFAAISMLILFLVKMVRNKQIDWFLIGLLAVLCFGIHFSYQLLEIAQELAQS